MATFTDNIEENSYVGTAGCLVGLQSEHFNKLAASNGILDEREREKLRPLTTQSAFPSHVQRICVPRTITT
jgi:hypothetical protein